MDLDSPSDLSSVAPPRSLKRSKSKSETYVHDQLQGLKDEAGLLRLKATQLVAESDHIKRQIARFMKTHQHDILESPTSPDAGDEHQDDHRALANEALAILSTISIDVSKMRAPSQSVAFQGVDQKVGKLEAQLEDLAITWDEATLEKLRVTTQQLVNAADPDPSGAIDSKFQSQILGCSLFDQKSTRARLSDLLASIDDLRSYMESHPERRPSPPSSAPPTPAASPSPSPTPAASSSAATAATNTTNTTSRAPSVAAASARSAARSGRRPSPRASATPEDFVDHGEDEYEYRELPRRTTSSQHQEALRRKEAQHRAAVEARRAEARRAEARRLAQEEVRRRELDVQAARRRARDYDDARRAGVDEFFEDPYGYGRRAGADPYGRASVPRRSTGGIPRFPSRSTRRSPLDGWGLF